MPKKKETLGNGGERLLSFIQRVERLEEEKAALAANIKEIYADAKGAGYDTKTIRKIVSLRKLSKEERDEQEALLDIYKAAIGMLDGTPLGESALRRLEGKTDPEPDAAEAPDAPSVPDASAEPDKPEVTIEHAREMGRQAALDSVVVTKNPFPARDPRRAAWDEEWCRAAGSDGMEIPAAFRRSKKEPKPADAADKKAA